MINTFGLPIYLWIYYIRMKPILTLFIFIVTRYILLLSNFMHYQLWLQKLSMNGILSIIHFIAFVLTT